MKRIVYIAWLLLAATAVKAQSVVFDEWFTGGTLRVDCLREGSDLGDTVWVEHWIDRGAEWHGSRTQLLDPFDNGDYRVMMRDAATGRELYSRGYSNLFREYKDTPEGKTVKARFEETLLLPMPKGKVLIALQKRDSGTMKLQDQTVVEFQGLKGGEKGVKGSERKLSTRFDVAFVMQGFEEVTDEEYQRVCDRMTGVLFGKEPFASHRDDFNLYFVKGDAGVEYNTFGADRYAMTFKVWQLHDVLGTTPCDHIVIVLNNKKYGGGAIYNFYSVSSLHSMAESVLPHELGHGIGGLADEYVDEDLSYADLHRTAYEPLEPNITNLVDFQSKWKRLLPEGTPVPTPDRNVPRTENGPLGVYEGAGYSSKGVYRPAMHCMMRDYAPFCPVCKRRLEEVIQLYTR
ncbi:MAG: M64 family metallopeptidase [bacterium]